METLYEFVLSLFKDLSYTLQVLNENLLLPIIVNATVFSNDFALVPHKVQIFQTIFYGDIFILNLIKSHQQWIKFLLQITWVYITFN